jgi:imidazole glycerol-phosphate synthase subunit HisF
MLKKRLIGVVTVKDGWAVQSFGYKRHLPLGKPEVLVQNLDRWGADEILVQCIDRSACGTGPDLEVLDKISKLGIATPLIYAGGIGSREDAVKVVSRGADRVMLDTVLITAPKTLESIGRDLGTQAVIAHLPLRQSQDGLLALNYHSGSESSLRSILQSLPQEWVSELMLTDWSHEGHPESFDEQILQVSKYINKPLLCFGGISNSAQIKRILTNDQVVAVGVGNFLNHREHAMQQLKQEINSFQIRPAQY